MCCTFFGHRNLSPKIEPILRSAIIDLIENHNVTLFYVGNHGAFDSMVYKVLRELTEQLKAANQMKWIGMMNNIRNRAEEIVKSEVLFV